MVNLKTALIISGIHVLYYLYFQVGSDIMKRARSRNIPPSMTVLRLMEEFNVNVRMFNYNGKPYAMAWFKTIWINTMSENLRMKDKGSPDWSLKWIFFHELWHVRRNHKAWVLTMRFTFAFIPILLAVHWIPFVLIYVGFAFGMNRVESIFEKKANEFANKKMNR